MSCLYFPLGIVAPSQYFSSPALSTLMYLHCCANTKTINGKSIFRQGCTHCVECCKKLFYSTLDIYWCMCVLCQPYPPTINFLECWIHLSDGSATVVTLSHHGMRASNDCLREIAVSSNVFENISHPCLLFLYLLLTNT